MFKTRQLIGILTAVIIVFGLGLWGFRSYDGQNFVLLSRMGNTVSLFLRDSSSLQSINPSPWQLTAARYLAPWVTLGGALLAAVNLAIDNLRHDFRVVRARRKIGHVIVCGLGEVGLNIVQNLRDVNRAKRDDVVAVDINGDSANAVVAGRLGATVIQGDGRIHSVMRAAGLAGAATVIICAGDDASNVDIALGLKNWISDRGWASRARQRNSIARRIKAYLRGTPDDNKGRLLILVELRDEWLLKRLMDHDKDALGDRNVEIRLFNTYQNMARLLVRMMSPPPALSDAEKWVAIIGFGSMGRELSIQLIQNAFAPLGQPVRLAIFDGDAQAAEKKFVPVLTRITDYATVAFQDCDLSLDSPAGWDAVRDYLRGHELAAAAVCLPDDKVSLYVAVELQAIADSLGKDMPIYFRLGRHASLGRFIGQKEPQQGHQKPLVPFGAFREILDVDVLIAETLDKLAKVNHENYRESLSEDRRNEEEGAREWHELAEQYKMSDRRASDFLRVRLAQISLDLKESPSAIDTPFEFSPDELELLAQLEHRRWMIERSMQGWRYGEVRDDAHRINPRLIDWSRLPEPERERNRNDVAKLPTILAEIGWQIFRAPSEEPAQPNLLPDNTLEPAGIEPLEAASNAAPSRLRA
jgi:voltage-gated potassium channel Kch